MLTIDQIMATIMADENADLQANFKRALDVDDCNEGYLREKIRDVLMNNPDIQAIDEIYDEIISRKSGRISKATHRRLVATFGPISDFAKDWASCKELKLQIARIGADHKASFEPACYVLHKAFPNKTPAEIAEHLKGCDVLDWEDLNESIIDTMLARNIAYNSVAARKQLLAMMKEFLHIELGQPAPNMISTIKFTFYELQQIMSKLNCYDQNELEKKLNEIRSAHPNDIVTGSDFLKFI